MNKKGLYVIIVLLVLVLAAGLVFVFVMPDPYDASADVPQTSQSPSDADMPAASANPTQESASEQQNPASQPSDEAVLPTDNAHGENSGDVPAEETVPVATNPDGSVDTATIPNLPDDVEVPESDVVTYEDYTNMSADEQMAFYDSFPSVEAFFEWYNAAEQAYKDSMIEIDGSTPIDFEEIFGGNGG